ncbi:hypothetical protein ACJX0J_021003, partial [Zea mays]
MLKNTTLLAIWAWIAHHLLNGSKLGLLMFLIVVFSTPVQMKTHSFICLSLVLEERTFIILWTTMVRVDLRGFGPSFLNMSSDIKLGCEKIISTIMYAIRFLKENAGQGFIVSA